MLLYLGKFDELGGVHLTRPRLTGPEGREVHENLTKSLHLNLLRTLNDPWLLALGSMDEGNSVRTWVSSPSPIPQPNPCGALRAVSSMRRNDAQKNAVYRVSSI